LEADVEAAMLISKLLAKFRLQPAGVEVAGSIILLTPWAVTDVATRAIAAIE